jgi:hypothetical protein
LSESDLREQTVETVTNPYTPPTHRSDNLLTGRHWLRRFLMLNSALILVPGLLLLAVYLSIEWSIRSQMKTSAGGPVLYEHSLWFDIEPLMAVAYLAVPNTILFAFFMYAFFRSQRHGNTLDEGD